MYFLSCEEITTFIIIALTEFCNQSQIKPAFRALLLISLSYKKGVHAFSCVYIGLRMHAGSLENIQEARVAQKLLRLCSANLLRASINRYTDTINNFIKQGRELLPASFHVLHYLKKK